MFIARSEYGMFIVLHEHLSRCPFAGFALPAHGMHPFQIHILLTLHAFQIAASSTYKHPNEPP